MKKLQITSDPNVEKVFNRYPGPVKRKIGRLRKLILDTAKEIMEITHLEETLKWGEPSYITKMGSTLRIDWKEKKPDQYAMYFKCTTKLVPSFKKVYKDTFKYEGDRAIVFQMDEKIPEPELKQCIKASLTYHKVKKLPLLGLKQ